jgi:hypothetical protein
MPLVNWPPTATYPAWPPPEFQTDWFSCSDWVVLLHELQKMNFAHDAPSQKERSDFFSSARCGQNHQVIGRMLVSPDTFRRYPFAMCNNGQHRELLVLWDPYTCGFQSAPVSF